MNQSTVTLIVGGLGICGTLGGVVSGHFLTRSWQREQWELDNRRQEYRELITSITAAYMALAHIHEETARNRPVTPEISLQAEQAKIVSFRTLRDRILIAEEIAFANSLVEWDTAVQNYLDKPDERVFSARFTAINQMLVDMARVPVRKQTLKERFLSWRLSRLLRKTMRSKKGTE